MVQHAVDIKVQLPVIKRVMDTEADQLADVRELAEALFDEGAAMAYVMIEAAHGDDRAADVLPSPRDLHNWRMRSNQAVALAWEIDAQSVEDYISRLGAEDQQLLRSCIRSGERQFG